MVYHNYSNLRNTCATRVTVVGLVLLYVSLHFINEQSSYYKAINSIQILKFCEDLSERTTFKSYDVTHEQKSQCANYSGGQFLCLMHNAKPEVTRILSTTFSLAQNNAF